MTKLQQAQPTSLILVTGHAFGVRAFEGIFASSAFLDGQIQVPLMIGLDDSHATATVGYQSLGPLAAEQGVRYIATSDGRLTSLAGQIRAAAPAYILVIGWSHLIPAEILMIPAAIAGQAGATSSTAAARTAAPGTAAARTAAPGTAAARTAAPGTAAARTAAPGTAAARTAAPGTAAARTAAPGTAAARTAAPGTAAARTAAPGTAAARTAAPGTAAARTAAPGTAAAGEFGCIGMHPTKLPDGRGQAPIPWTIIKGCSSTALSVFFLEPGADTGPIIAQYDLDVRERETAASLFYRIAHAHFTAGLELADGLASRQVSSRPQDQNSATRWPKRRPRDGEILATMTCREVDALVRALLGSYPRAFVQAGGETLYVRGVEAAPAPAVPLTAQPAAIGDHRIRFQCSDGVVDLLRAYQDDGAQP